jgi:NAD(P)H dehydrogenase (quinone)
MIVITGATGQLGHLVIEALIQEIPSSQIIAAVRNPEKAKDLEAKGIEVRKADYNEPETLLPAFKGAEKLLLISSSEVGQRIRQHGAVIEAAKNAGIKLLAYTSVLHANSTPLAMLNEHKETEKILQASGIAFVSLRNGWYNENYTSKISGILEQGVILGSVGPGRIASAERADYAGAAAAVLIGDGHAGHIYELAGDKAFTMAELAAEITRQSGKTIEYRDMSVEDYRAALISNGTPEELAPMLADMDAGISKGALFDDSRQLSQLIGHPTTPIEKTIEKVIKGLP